MEYDWNDIEKGETISSKIDFISSSGNGVVTIGDREVNIGQVTEDSVGEEVKLQKVSSQFAMCLIPKFRKKFYFDSHPASKGNFYYNINTKQNPKYMTLISGNDHPQPGERFVAKIDRIGRSGKGIIDTSSGHDVIVSGVDQDDKGELIEAEMIKSRTAEKIADDVTINKDMLLGGRTEDSSNDIREITSPKGTQETNSSSDGQTVDFEVLRERAEKNAVQEVPEETTTVTHVTSQYNRSNEIREYVKARSDGVCEGCEEPAPFTSKTGEPYLHAHHVHELSGGGSDTPDTVIALCPNCHYRVHHGEDGEEFNQDLIQRLANIEDVSLESIRESP